MDRLILREMVRTEIHRSSREIRHWIRARHEIPIRVRGILFCARRAVRLHTAETMSLMRRCWRFRSTRCCKLFGEESVRWRERNGGENGQERRIASATERADVLCAVARAAGVSAGDRGALAGAPNSSEPCDRWTRGRDRIVGACTGRGTFAQTGDADGQRALRAHAEPTLFWK